MKKYYILFNCYRMHGGQQQKKSLSRKLEIVDAQIKQVQKFKH